MDMKAGLFQQQSLKLSMTQELSQAIALLQYSAQELEAFLENKLLENPLLSLERAAGAIEPASRDRNKTAGSKGRGEGNQSWLEQIGEDPVTLEKFLLSQLDVRRLDGHRRPLYLHLIRSLDENGYLRTDLQEAAAICGAAIEDAESCLADIQSLEPYGIGARNLQECLLIQARREGMDELTEQLLSTHFMPFAEKKWKELSRELGVPLKEIQAVFDLVQFLNPRPGAAFHKEKPAYVVPDVAVEIREGRLTVGDYDGNGPKLGVDSSYLKQLKKNKDQDMAKYWQEKLQEFQWIQRGISQRKETILNVMACIADKQYDFFLRGLNYLKPMTMKEIADELGVHESTVSRAVKDKYVQTPFGTVEMRSFFSSALQSTTMVDASGTRAKSILEELVRTENKLNPLSDQELAEILEQKHGIVLSRRTVAKYRSQLGIAASSKRKRYE